MKICSINSAYKTTQKSDLKESKHIVSFSKAVPNISFKKAIPIKLERLKLNLQRIISDYKWNKFIKELNNDVAKMPKSKYPNHYDFRNHT